MDPGRLRVPGLTLSLWPMDTTARTTRPAPADDREARKADRLAELLAAQAADPFAGLPR